MKRCLKLLRSLKVYKILRTAPPSQENNFTGAKPIPEIRLNGSWLQDIGFHPGDSIQVACEPKKITITLNEDLVQSSIPLRISESLCA